MLGRHAGQLICGMWDAVFTIAGCWHVLFISVDNDVCFSCSLYIPLLSARDMWHVIVMLNIPEVCCGINGTIS